MGSKVNQALARRAEALATQRSTEADLRALAEMVAPLIVPEIVRALIETLSGSQAYLEGVITQSVQSIPRPVDRTNELIAAMGSIEIPETDLGPVLQAINRISIPEAQDVNLAPILKAVKGIKVPEGGVKKWRLVHHRDKRGRLIETECIAE